MYPVQKDGKAEYIMSKLTAEEQRLLKLNRNVEYVSDVQVKFAAEFKRYAFQKQDEGIPMRQIFLDNGLDPEILGSKRLENFSAMLRKKRRQGKNFTGCSPGAEEKEKELDLKAELCWLKHELEYTKQEVEFLKKIQMANTEARKQWELKHRPT